MSQQQYRHNEDKRKRDAEQQRSSHKTQSQSAQQPSATIQCPYCHREIKSGLELCPHCGRPLSDDHCTFCGTPFEGGEMFCSECGSPRSGITCPQCGTLSFRSFCSHCNYPLNDNAHKALREAYADPKFQRVQQLHREIQDMEEYLRAFKDEVERAIAEAELEDEEGPNAPGLSEEGEALKAKYAELMKLLGQAAVPQAPKQQKQQERPSVKRREQLKARFADASAIMAAYQAKAAEMQQAMADMLPDANETPQIQRDFACARKLATITSSQQVVPDYWECNYCHCFHGQPSECCEPQLGGTWHYRTITVTNKVWDYVN